jgi:MFS family permease
MLTVTALALGATVLMMSQVSGVLMLAVLVTLTRGLGQSALSVVSLTIVGQWFTRRLNLAMAVYTVLLSAGFMAAFPTVGAMVIEGGWRGAWFAVGGAILLVLVPAGWLLVRRTPEACGVSIDGEKREEREDRSDGYTLRQALSTAAFWVFALSSAVYGLIASGIALFNESILIERGFDAAVYHRSLVITALTALAGNFLGGWLTTKWTMKRLMSAAMWLLAASLVALPHVSTEAHVVMYALVMGLAGGFVIVIFFSFWSRTYGRAHLGRIQGAAQTLTVVASAVGPLLLAECVARTGSYKAMFYLLAIVVGALGLSAWLVRVPAISNSTNSLAEADIAI